jgi:hypothetical protein
MLVWLEWLDGGDEAADADDVEDEEAETGCCCCCCCCCCWRMVGEVLAEDEVLLLKSESTNLLTLELVLVAASWLWKRC